MLEGMKEFLLGEVIDAKKSYFFHETMYIEQGYLNNIYFILTFLDLSNASRTNSVAGLPPSPNPSDGVTSVGQSRKWHKTSLGGMIRNASSISEKGKFSINGSGGDKG